VARYGGGLQQQTIHFIYTVLHAAVETKDRVQCHTIIGLFSSPIHLNLSNPASFAAATASAPLHRSVSKYAALLLLNLQCFRFIGSPIFGSLNRKVPTGQQ
jgi:hypothetical protein